MESIYKVENEPTFATDENIEVSPEQEIPSSAYTDFQHAFSDLENEHNVDEALLFLNSQISLPGFSDMIKDFPSNIVTVLIAILRQYQENPELSMLAIQFILNIWESNLSFEPMFDPDLFQIIAILSSQDNNPDLSIASILSLTELIPQLEIESTPFTNLFDLLLNQEIFPLYLQKLANDPDKPTILIILTFINTILEQCKPKSYKNPYQQKMIEFILGPKLNRRPFEESILFKLLDLPDDEIQQISFEILLNLSRDRNSFDCIFQESFTQQFLAFIISNKNPDLILKSYEILAKFPSNGKFDELKSPEFLSSIEENIHLIKDLDLTSLFNLIDIMNNIDDSIIANTNIWPTVFELADEFPLKNKQGFANLLSSYFLKQNLELIAPTADIQVIGSTNQIALSLAENGGFTFLCDTVPQILDPIHMKNGLDCIFRLLKINPPLFEQMIKDTNLIDELQEKLDYIPSQKSDNQAEQDEHEDEIEHDADAFEQDEIAHANMINPQQLLEQSQGEDHHYIQIVVNTLFKNFNENDYAAIIESFLRVHDMIVSEITEE